MSIDKKKEEEETSYKVEALVEFNMDEIKNQLAEYRELKKNEKKKKKELPENENKKVELTENEKENSKEENNKFEDKMYAFVKIKERNTVDWILFFFYKIFRVFYVGFYFYFFTLAVLFIDFIVPLHFAIQ